MSPKERSCETDIKLGSTKKWKNKNRRWRQKKSMTLNEKRKYLANKRNKNWSLVDKKALRTCLKNTTLKKIVFFRNIFRPQLQCWWLHYLPLVYFVWPVSPSLSFHTPSLSPLSSLIPSLPFASDRERYLMWEPTKSLGAFAHKKKKIGQTKVFHQNKINKCTKIVIYKIKLIKPHTECAIANKVKKRRYKKNNNLAPNFFRKNIKWQNMELQTGEGIPPLPPMMWKSTQRDTSLMENWPTIRGKIEEKIKIMKLSQMGSYKSYFQTSARHSGLS